MDNQSVEDKLSVLTNIFGNDLTDDVIAETLRAANNSFDAAVEKLLTLPSNKPKEVRPQQEQPLDPKSLDNIKRLQNMFGDLTQSVITTVFETHSRDVDVTVDTLLNITSNEVASGAQKEAEIARQEQEIRAYEDFKRAQQRMQEEDRKQSEAAQQLALQRAKEEEQKRKEVEKKAIDEHTRALQEQEKMLLEFQRKKEEQERLKKEQEEKLKELQKNEEIQRKEALEKARLMAVREKERLEQEKIRIEKERQELEKEKRKKEEHEKRRLELEQEKKRIENIEKEEKLRQQARKETEERLEKQKIAREEEMKRIAEERRLQEALMAREALAEQNEALRKQNQRAEAERKMLEARMQEELKREEEEKKRLIDNEKRFKEEQENIRRDWEEKVRKLENERRIEEQKRMEDETRRAEAKRLDEEERARHEADMRKVLELERLKLDEQRKRIDEERKSGEARLRAMEEAARLREEEEAQRLQAERDRILAEERKREEEERARLLQEEAQARERIVQEQFAASAIMVEKASDELKVEITAELEGADSIKGSWAVVQGTLSPQAWLGLFARRAMNTNAGYQYLSGSSGTFHFKGLTPGHYEVRIFASKPVTTRIAESGTVLVGPKVVHFAVQQQAGQLMLEYTLDPPATPSSRDWVGLYERSQRRNQNYLTSVYGTNAGTVTLQQPKTPGEYELRLFVTNAKYNDQAAVQFMVNDNDQISGEVVEGVIKAKWVMRTVETTSSDWIGLFAAGENNNNNNNNNNNSKGYFASVYTNALPEGSVDIPIPKDIAKGLYELRLFSSKVGKYVTFKTSDVISLD